MSTSIALPKVFQLPWYSLSGYTAYLLQKSCLGNDLDTTAKRIAAYIPRILVAFPLIVVAGSLDLALYSPGIVTVLVISTIIQLCMNCQWIPVQQFLSELTAFVCLPLILLGHLLIGKIPESARSQSFFFNESETDEINRSGARWALGRPYHLERILDSANAVGRRAEMWRSSTSECSLLSEAVKRIYMPVVRNRANLKCLDILVRAGAEFDTLSEEDRLDIIFHASHCSVAVLRRIVQLPGFNLTDKYTLQAMNCRPGPLYNHLRYYKYETLNNIGMMEFILLLHGVDGIMKLLETGIQLGLEECVELSRFEYFSKNPAMNPKTMLHTTFSKINNQWVFITAPVEEKEKIESGQARLGFKTLEDSQLYKIWQILQQRNNLVSTQSVQSRGMDQWKEAGAASIARIKDALLEPLKKANFPIEICNIITSYVDLTTIP